MRNILKNSPVVVCLLAGQIGCVTHRSVFADDRPAWSYDTYEYTETVERGDKGPIKLIDIDPATGWIADNTSWKSGLTKIVPAKEFKGDRGHSSWLQNEDLAFIYRAYSSYDNPLTITSPGNCWPTMPALEPGVDVSITVGASRFRDWKTIVFCDGAKKLGEVTAGSAPRFTAKDLRPGYHVFSILATDGEGNVRTADPKLVIVKASGSNVRK